VAGRVVNVEGTSYFVIELSPLKNIPSMKYDHYDERKKRKMLRRHGENSFPVDHPKEVIKAMVRP